MLHSTKGSTRARQMREEHKPWSVASGASVPWGPLQLPVIAVHRTKTPWATLVLLPPSLYSSVRCDKETHRDLDSGFYILLC